MSKEHTVKSFDEAMTAVEQDVMRMGLMARSQLHQVIEALRDVDAEKAEAVVAADDRMDELDRQVSDAVQRILALRQPLAEDLRALISCDRIATDLERIGDYLKNIARRLLVLWQGDVKAPTDGILRLTEMVLPLVEQALQALEQRDVAAAEDVCRRDDQIDREYEQLAERMTEDMCREQSSAASCMQLLFIAKAIERVGDHATNVSEDVIYWVSGERPTKRRPPADPAA